MESPLLEDFLVDEWACPIGDEANDEEEDEAEDRFNDDVL